jgi:hypothetical protein
MELLDILGWISSALVVWSLMVARVLRFRVLNLVGAGLATVVNALLGIWPFAAMNGIIAVIDVYWIWRLLRERHDAKVYEVVELGMDDAYVRHWLDLKAKEIGRTHPSFRIPEPEARAERMGLLVMRGDETVGMVVIRDAGSGVGEVELDFVTERFRDFTPGEFVYESSGIFPARGFTRLRLVDDVTAEHDYYSRVGFRKVDGQWEREVQPAA